MIRCQGSVSRRNTSVPRQTSFMMRQILPRHVPPMPTVPTTRRLISTTPSEQKTKPDNVKEDMKEGLKVEPKEDPKPVGRTITTSSPMYMFRVGVMSVATFGGFAVAGPFGGMVGLGMSAFILEASK